MTITNNEFVQGAHNNYYADAYTISMIILQLCIFVGTVTISAILFYNHLKKTTNTDDNKLKITLRATAAACFIASCIAYLTEWIGSIMIMNNSGNGITISCETSPQLLMGLIGPVVLFYRMDNE